MNKPKNFFTIIKCICWLFEPFYREKWQISLQPRPQGGFPSQGRAPWGRGWFPYPFIYLMTEKGTPFWWSLPVKAVIGSNVTAPWDPKAPEAFFLFFHKELRNAHTFLSSLGAVGAVHRLVLVLMHQEKPLTPIPEECRALAVACVAGVERGRG